MEEFSLNLDIALFAILNNPWGPSIAEIATDVYPHTIIIVHGSVIALAKETGSISIFTYGSNSSNWSLLLSYLLALSNEIWFRLLATLQS